METLEDNYLNYPQHYGNAEQQHSHRQAHYLPDSATNMPGGQCIYPGMHPDAPPKSSASRMAPPLKPLSSHHNGMSPQHPQQHSPGVMTYAKTSNNFVSNSYHPHGLQSSLGSPGNGTGIVDQQRQQPVVSNYVSFVNSNNNNNHLHHEMNISNTLTHISETDSSNNNYPTPPLTQGVGPRNDYQTPPARFNSFHPQHQPPEVSSWQSNVVNQTTSKPGGSKLSQHYNNNVFRNSSAYETVGVHSQHHYLTSQAADYQHSITSTPMVINPKQASTFHGHSQNVAKMGKTADYYYSSQNTSPNPVVSQQLRPSQQNSIVYGNGTNLSIKKEKTTTQVANDTHELMPEESVTRSDFQRPLPSSNVLSTLSAARSETYERRSLVIFKVIDQLVHPTTKRVVKQTTLKSEEFITPCGIVHLNATEEIAPPTGSSGSGLSSLSHSVVGSSGNLADLSSNVHSKTSSGEVFNHSSTDEEMLASLNPTVGNREPNRITTTITRVESDDNDSGRQVLGAGGGGGDDEMLQDDEDEERSKTTAATVLLSLHTPVKAPQVSPDSLGEEEEEVVANLENSKKNFHIFIDKKPALSPSSRSIGSISTNILSSNSCSSSNSPKLSNITTEVPNETYGCLKQNMKVFAKWKDRKYYCATLTKKLEASKWSVRFEDGAYRNLTESEMIRVNAVGVGTEVMVKVCENDDGSIICLLALVTKLHASAEDERFELEHVDREHGGHIRKLYSLGDLFLNPDQGALVISRMAKPSGAVFGEVDLDNIVSGKRLRGKQIEQTKKETANAALASASSTTTATSVSKRKAVNSSSDSSSLATRNSIDVNNNLKKRRKISKSDGKEANFVASTEKQPSLKAAKKIAPKKRRAIAETSRPIEDVVSRDDSTERIVTGNEANVIVSPLKSDIPSCELAKTLGPIPGERLLFQGFAFLLTQGDRLNDAPESRSDPFDKTYLSKQIRVGGGSIFETFDAMKESNLECVLIADTYHRSIEYIQCLAGGVPILSHLWVIESCRLGKLQPKEAHILPAGYDEITHTLSSDKNAFKKSSTLFREAKFYFGSTEPEKIETSLAPILQAARSVIVKQDSKMSTILSKKLVDIIVADASCPAQLVARAKMCRVPVVSSEYIIQCLINGKRLSVEASPIFSHTYQQIN